MTVYVVYGAYNFEGFTEPAGVFSTLEKAQEAVQYVRGADIRYITKYEVDPVSHDGELPMGEDCPLSKGKAT